MQIGFLTQPNTKGQIVIPKKMRDLVGIKPGSYVNIIHQNRGIYIYPVDKIVSSKEREEAFGEILEKTRGLWAGDNWPETEKRRRKIELKATRENRKAW